jgi:hypothetical protein
VKVVLDWSIISHTIWERMSSPQYEGATDIEIQEFSRNTAEFVFYLYYRFPETDFIFALDAPKKTYWRHEILNDYYKKHIVVFHNDTDNSYIFHYNKAYYHITYHEPSAKWYQVKLNKTEYSELASAYTEVQGVPEALLGFFPKYKKRISNWSYETPYDVFKKMSKAIGRNLARTVNGKAILVNGAEADDIAYVISDMYPAETLIYVTYDSDWKQIGARHLFTNYLDPRDKRAFVAFTSAEALFDIWVKIIAGDKSDTIPGIALEGKSQLLGKTRAEALVREMGTGDIGKYLRRKAERTMLDRNLKLIVLKNSPKELQEAIKKAISLPMTQGKIYQWEDYGLEGLDQIRIQEEAESDGRNFPVPG